VDGYGVLPEAGDLGQAGLPVFPKHLHPVHHPVSAWL
jgi:hypothetical protein